MAFSKKISVYTIIKKIQLFIISFSFFFGNCFSQINGNAYDSARLASINKRFRHSNQTLKENYREINVSGFFNNGRMRLQGSNIFTGYGLGLGFGYKRNHLEIYSEYRNIIYNRKYNTFYSPFVFENISIIKQNQIGVGINLYSTDVSRKFLSFYAGLGVSKNFFSATSDQNVIPVNSVLTFKNNVTLSPKFGFVIKRFVELEWDISRFSKQRNYYNLSGNYFSLKLSIPIIKRGRPKFLRILNFKNYTWTSSPLPSKDIPAILLNLGMAKNVENITSKKLAEMVIYNTKTLPVSVRDNKLKYVFEIAITDTNSIQIRKPFLNRDRNAIKRIWLKEYINALEYFENFKRSIDSLAVSNIWNKDIFKWTIDSIVAAHYDQKRKDSINLAERITTRQRRINKLDSLVLKESKTLTTREYYHLSRYFFEKSNIEDAVHYVNEAIDLDSNNIQLYRLRGLIYLNKEFIVKAVQDFSKIKKMATDSMRDFNGTPIIIGPIIPLFENDKYDNSIIVSDTYGIIAGRKYITVRNCTFYSPIGIQTDGFGMYVGNCNFNCDIGIEYTQSSVLKENKITNNTFKRMSSNLVK